MDEKMADFTEYLRLIFRRYLPMYIGKAHQKTGDKIKNDGTPAGNLDNFMLTALRVAIASFFPKDQTIAEEDCKDNEQLQELLKRNDEFQWTIDGLDGTGNRSLGINSFGAMVSRRRGEKILYAAVFRPVDEQLRGNGFFYAELGQGAWQWCGDCRRYEKLSTLKEGYTDRMTVMLEGSSKKFFNPSIIDLGKNITTRSSFSSCVAVTIVAQGKANALVTIDHKPWDNWPAMLFIAEAGGIVTDWQNRPCTPQNFGIIIASANKTDHEKILSLIRRW